MKLDEIVLGDKVRCVETDHCLKVGSVYDVTQDEDGDLCVVCDQGYHYFREDDHGNVRFFERVSV
jgi:hypothetical protein